MQYRRLGRSGLQVSEIGLGTWLTLGAKLDRAAGRALVHAAFELGINLFDTADVYADGAAERELGRALGELPRSQVVIATKAFFPTSDHPNAGGLSRKHLFESVDASLRRLGTDYVDLHQCHRADPDTPLEETVCAYEDLIRQGKVLYWGVSLWAPKAIEDACAIAEARHAYRPIASQPEYSILRRDSEAELFATCRREGLSQLVFSPLAQGVLTGKYARGTPPPDSRASDDTQRWWMDDRLAPEAAERVAALAPLAEELGVTLAQLAIAWCLREPNVASALAGASRPEQLESNVAASGTAIPADVAERIDAIAPRRSG